MNFKTSNKNICFIATVPMAFTLSMRPHIEEFSKNNRVTLIANGDAQDFLDYQAKNIRIIPLKIERKISILADLYALISLIKILKSERFDMVFSRMPKSGLLGMLAAFIARVPLRIHMFTGQVWATKMGLPRWGLKQLDRLMVFCATHVLADGHAQKTFLEIEGVAKNITVLGGGSVSGIDTIRFSPNAAMRKKIRTELSIPEDAIIYLFLGRLNHEKGILDLAQAFSELQLENAHLLFVGPDEGDMSNILTILLNKCLTKYHRINFTKSPEEYMASADVLCLPSYREGFSSVIIEAASTGIPSIASNIYGIVDAVLDGKTGILHPARDVAAIKKAIVCLYEDNNLRKKMGQNALQLARTKFSQELLVHEMQAFYKKICAKLK